MKNYKISMKEIGTEIWDDDTIQDYIEAENEEEAIELAKQHILEITGDESYSENFRFSAREI